MERSSWQKLHTEWVRLRDECFDLLGQSIDGLGVRCDAFERYFEKWAAVGEEHPETRAGQLALDDLGAKHRKLQVALDAKNCERDAAYAVCKAEDDRIAGIIHSINALCDPTYRRKHGAEFKRLGLDDSPDAYTPTPEERAKARLDRAHERLEAAQRSYERAQRDAERAQGDKPPT